ncbi:hypothetical protein QRX50_20775 [Amycolatopsis carbonis]|uniref:Uncharacterized protein n=1 Tax=Amycolatopsis carbonis TaxID=715471 RepID=A0A9Y2N1G1_9PSEU|nr:hypothetical protein [Amycolatopsis sp. 2-15]WIX83019.1 hypothetical protein QRX50_20775 [Amycolatopsis sp. 2-15]
MAWEELKSAYRDSQKRWYDEVVQLDFDVRRGAMFTGVKTLHDGVQVLEEIAKKLDS